VPIAELRDRAVDWYSEQKRTKETLRKVRQVFRYLMEDLGVKWADELEDPAVIRRFERAIKSPNFFTRRGTLAVLQSILNRAEGWGLLVSVPAFPDYVRYTGRRSPKGTRSKVPSTAAFNRLMEHLQSAAGTWDGGRICALVAIVALAGIAVSQALRLRVADIDLERDTIWVQGGRLRRHSPDSPRVPIRINDRLRAILAGWLPRTGCEWAFPGIWLLGPWSLKALQYKPASRPQKKPQNPLEYLGAACRAAGVGRITFEALRRYFAENAVPSVPLDAPGADGRQESARLATRPKLAVVLRGPGEDPIVWGRRRDRLTDREYLLVSALLQGPEKGLTSGELKEVLGGKKGAVTTLSRLKKKHADWDRAILFPGNPYGRYRIAPGGEG
jgi:integrase